MNAAQVAFLGEQVEHRIEEQSEKLQQQGDDQRAQKHPVQLRSRLQQACIKNKSPLPLCCSWRSPFCCSAGRRRQDFLRCCCPRTFRDHPLPDVAAAVIGGSSVSTTGASCGSSDAAGGIAAAAVDGVGTAAGDEAGAGAARGVTPTGVSARATGTKASADGTGTRRGCPNWRSAAGTGTGPSCATGSVRGSWGRCWFLSPGCPSEHAPAAESLPDYFLFSSGSVSSR